MRNKLRFLMILTITLIGCEKERKSEQLANTVINNQIIAKQNQNAAADNIIEISIIFDKNKATYERSLDLKNTSGAMFSAYSLDTENYEIDFSVLIENEWSDWSKLSINPEVKNPHRKVYSPLHLKPVSNKIRFKCSGTTSSPVVFRFFKYDKL